MDASNNIEPGPAQDKRFGTTVQKIIGTGDTARSLQKSSFHVETVCENRSALTDAPREIRSSTGVT